MFSQYTWITSYEMRGSKKGVQNSMHQQMSRLGAQDPGSSKTRDKVVWGRGRVEGPIGIDSLSWFFLL